MKDEIKNKLDEHIRQLLDKPSLSDADYAILKEKLAEYPADRWGDFLWLSVFLILLFPGWGGERHGV